MTCRQLHAEAALLPYTLNVFCVYILDLKGFLDSVPTSIKSTLKAIVVYFPSALVGLCANSLHRDRPFHNWRRIDYTDNLEALAHVPQLEEVVMIIGRHYEFDKEMQRVEYAIKKYNGRHIEVLKIGIDEAYDGNP